MSGFGALAANEPITYPDRLMKSCPMEKLAAYDRMVCVDGAFPATGRALTNGFAIIYRTTLSRSTGIVRQTIAQNGPVKVIMQKAKARRIVRVILPKVAA